MKQLSLFILKIFALLTALSPSGCAGSDSVDGPVDVTTWDIATFTGNSAGHAIFTVSPGNDAPEAVLTAQRAVESDNIKPGDRVYIAYVPADNRPYTTGPITLSAVTRINQADVEAVNFNPDGGWDNDPVYLLTVWRTGTYLNIYCRLPYSTEPRIFTVTADRATVGTPRPQLYLNHTLPENVNSFSRAYYASFDISAIWNLPATEAVDFHINNSNLPVTTYTFPR